MEGSLMEKLFEPWPPWVERRWGIIARVAVMVAGLAVGGILLFFAYFAATFKKNPAVWDVEALTMLAGGLLVGIAGLGFALRPSRLTAAALALGLAIPGIIGSLL